MQHHADAVFLGNLLDQFDRQLFDRSQRYAATPTIKIERDRNLAEPAARNLWLTVRSREHTKAQLIEHLTGCCRTPIPRRNKYRKPMMVKCGIHNRLTRCNVGKL